MGVDLVLKPLWKFVAAVGLDSWDLREICLERWEGEGRRRTRIGTGDLYPAGNNGQHRRCCKSEVLCWKATEDMAKNRLVFAMGMLVEEGIDRDEDGSRS